MVEYKVLVYKGGAVMTNVVESDANETDLDGDGGTSHTVTSAPDEDCTIVSMADASVGGTANDDVICTASDDVTVDAGDGNDVVYCPGLNANCDGGIGDDELHCFGGASVCDGGEGNNDIACTGELTICLGDFGVDYIVCTGACVQCLGGPGMDELRCDTTGAGFCDGQEDDDKLVGGRHNNRLLGGLGDDFLNGVKGPRTTAAAARAGTPERTANAESNSSLL